MRGRSERRVLPGESGLWVFIFVDLALFALFFALEGVDRVRAPAVFQQGRASLDLTGGMINTLVLLAGSWAVVMGTRIERDTRRSALYLHLASATGAVFLLLKAGEWARHVRLGHRISDDAFETWYFFLTGFHAVHVAAAVVLLLVVAARRRRAEQPSAILIEAAGCYWHLVDLLWIGIYLVMYLL